MTVTMTIASMGGGGGFIPVAISSLHYLTYYTHYTISIALTREMTNGEFYKVTYHLSTNTCPLGFVTQLKSTLHFNFFGCGLFNKL